MNPYQIERQKARNRYKEAFSNFKEDFFKAISDKIFSISNITHEKEAYSDMLLSQVLVEDMNENASNIHEFLINERIRNCIFNEFLPSLAKNLILNRTYNWPDCQKCSDTTLWECQKLFFNLFHLDNHHLAEMVKLIWDADRNYYKVNNIDEYNLKPFGAELRPSKERQAWLQSLQIGDEIDAVKTERTQGKQIWSRSQIILIKEKIFVRFLEDNDDFNSSFFPNYEIAPLGSHSVDWDWRKSLEINDEIDVCDTSGTWYPSTVLAIRNRKQNDRYFTEIYIGYRVFRENAEKIDQETGKTFQGWSSKYDEWLSIHNPRVQKFGRFSRETTSLSSAQNEIFDDSNDIIFEEEGVKEEIFANQHKFAINRSKICKCSSLILWVNTLGAMGLFNKIMDRICDKKNWCPIDFLANLLMALGNLHGILYRKFALEYLPKILNASFENVLNTPESNFRNFTKDKIEGVITGLEKIAKRLYTVKDRYEVVENFTLKVSLLCFKSSILERKIQGLKMIQDIIKNIKLQDYKSIGYKDLGIWLESNNIFDDLYGSGSHSQLIQRSSDFLRFLLNEDLLTTNHLAMIWQGIGKGDLQTKISIYKMISDLSMSFNGECVDYLVARISEIDVAKIGKDDIDLLYELAKFSNKGGDFAIKALGFLWKILAEPKSKVSKEIYEFVLEKTGDLVSSYYLKDYRMSIIERCLKNIEENSAVYASLKVLNKTIDAYPEKVMGHFSSVQVSRSVICEDLVTRCNIIEVIFKNLVTFKSYIREKAQNSNANEITEPFLNKFIKDHVSYFDHITERVLTLQNVVKSLLDENPIKNTFALLSKLWDEIVGNHLIPQEENALFRWIREFSDFEKENTVVNLADIKNFFHDKMLKNEKLKNSLSIDGLACFKNMFLTVNKHLKLIEIISKTPEKEEYNLNFPSANSKDYNTSSYEEKITPRLLVLVEPEQLEGIKFLWDCCLENKNEEIGNKAIEFLLELYMNNFKTSEEFVMRTNEGFIKKCFTEMKECCNLLKDCENSFYEKKILRAIIAINSFMDESEKTGIGNLKSHNANVKGETITVNVYNDNIVLGSNAPKNIELKVSNNLTLFALRVEIAKMLQTSWDAVRLIRPNSGRELKDKENGWTLGELRVKNGEKFQGRRRQTPPVPEANLVLLDGSMNPRFLKIVTDWFETFSTNGKMNPDQCATFTNACTRNCEMIINAGDRKIKEVFEKWDRDNDGYLSKEDFIDFYHNAAINRPKYVWHNLAGFHFRNDLRKEYEVEQGEVNIKILPRYLISKDVEYYHILFSLIKEKGKIADEVWKLLNRLPTSPEILKKVMNLEGVKDANSNPNWGLLLDINNNYLLLYCLNIFEYLMEDESAKEYQLESDQFRTDFIHYGGFEHLFNIFKAYNEKDRASLTFLDKNILNFILKIIKNYVIAALCNKIPNLNKMIQLIRMSYISLDNIIEFLDCEDLSKIEFKDDKKMEGARKKLEETLQHKELSDKLKGELGDKILETIDLFSFKDGLLILGLDILMKDINEIEIEERGIIELILILLLGIYLYSEKSLNSLIMPGTHEAFYLNGLFCVKSQIIRKNFHHAFFILIREKKEVLGGYYIKLLLENIPDGSIEERRESLQFYDVLTKLLEQCYGTFDFDYSALTAQMIEKITFHQSQETRSQPYPDNILLGYISLLGKLLEVSPELRKTYYDFAFYLFEEGLFDINPKSALYKEELLLNLENKSHEKDLINNYVKCKCNQTRRAAYKVIVNYVKNNDELFVNLLEKCIIPLIKRAPRTDKTWNFSPMFNGRSTQAGFSGIKNLGCICYMTAMIQQFFMNEHFRYALLRADDKEPPNTVPFTNNPKILIDDNVLHQLQKLFVFLELTDRQDYNPFEFCFSFKDYSGLPVNVLMQQDAQEFINMIFEKLENSLKSTPFCQVLENVYGGKVCNQMICSNCKNVTNRFENFYNLSLQVKSMKHIFESLNKYIAGETISDYECENCLKKVDINKRIVLSSLPNVLIIHLQRLVFNLDTLMNEKINSRLDFPHELNMQPFMREEIEKREKEAINQSNEEHNKNASNEEGGPKSLLRKSSSYSEEKSDNQASFHEKGYYEYQLKGVVNHTGSAEAGHYYSFIKLYEGRWLELNDSVVKEFDIRLLEQECFGGNNGTNGAETVDDYWGWEGKENAKSAYILVYERKMKEPFTLKINNSEDLKSIEDLKRKPVEGSDNLFTVDYYDMKKYIPENYYESVWRDNHEFMLEKHIYNEDFFKFILEFFKNLPDYPFNEKEPILPSYYDKHEKCSHIKPLVLKSAELILKYMSEILFRANDKNTLSDITKLLKGFFLVIPDEVMDIADRFIFQKPKDIFELLLSSSEMGVRTSVGQILISLITILIEHNEIFSENSENDEKKKKVHDKVVGFLTSLLNLMPQEVAKNWTKFQQYFEFWRDFALNGKKYIDFLNSKEAIALLVDFFLEKKSPLLGVGESDKRQKMGNQYQKPAFETVLHCLSLLIPPDFQVSKLTQKEKTCLFCKEFYEKITDEKYNYLMIGNIVEKMAYENESLSKDLAFVILKGVNRVAFDDVDPYLFLMISLLSINDSLQQQRMEQVLGYPQLYFNRYDNYGLYESLEEQYFSYESTLPWPDENISMLNYIYQNKKKWEVLCSVCLEKTLQLMDQNENVCNYIASIPGPSYIYNSYLDWVKPFVNDFIEEAKRMNYPKYSQEKIEKGNEILKFYNSIEKKLEHRHKKFEYSKGELISFISDYEPLIIGKTVGEIKKSEEILYKKRDEIISLSVVDSVVYLLDSKPNTFTNLSFPAVALDRNEFQNKIVHPDCSFFKMVNSFYWDDYKRKKLYERQDQTRAKEENPVDDNEIEETKQNINMINNNNNIEEKIYPNPSTTEETYQKNEQSSAELRKKSKLTIEIPKKKTENTENAKEKEEYSETINYEKVDVDKKEDRKKTYAMFDLPIKECNYIRRYILKNDTLENIRFEIKFNENPKNINLFHPQSVCKKIHMKGTQIIVTLLKKKCEEDWPTDFSFETKLDFPDLVVVKENISSNQSNLYGSATNTRVPYASTYPADGYGINDDVGGPARKCHLCESPVINEPSFGLVCSFCKTPYEG